MSELESLREVLNRYSKCVILEKNGSRVMVLERGARILGIFLGDSPNLLWVNPGIEEELKEDGWNVGGLRFWISPERNFFYSNPEKFESWFCPHGIDPGSYRIIESGSDRAVLEGEITAFDNLAGREFKASIRREVRLLEGGVKQLRLRIRDGMIGEYYSRVNPWALAQVPMGYAGVGTVLVPVNKGAKPIHYFTEIPKDRLKISANHIAFKIDGNFVSKLGIKPEDFKELGLGSVGYVYRVGKRFWSTLILRTSNIPLTQEECLDVPKRDPNLPRAAIQSYNSGSEAFKDIKFGEIELQLTPTQNIAGKIFASVEYDFIAAMGTRDDILRSVRTLLGIAKPKLY